jgi:hypothetical protein
MRVDFWRWFDIHYEEEKVVDIGEYTEYASNALPEAKG